MGDRRALLVLALGILGGCGLVYHYGDYESGGGGSGGASSISGAESVSTSGTGIGGASIASSNSSTVTSSASSGGAPGCMSSNDCSGGRCCKNGICLPDPPTCNDGCQDGTESDIDCGGDCKICP